MTNGFYQNGNCYSDKQNAIDTHFQNQPTSITVTNGVNQFIFHTRDSSGAWSYQKTNISDLGTVTNVFNIPVASPTFGTCQVLDFSQYDINPANVLYVTSWGLGFLLLMWSMGFAIGIATGVIKKL